MTMGKLALTAFLVVAGISPAAAQEQSLAWMAGTWRTAAPTGPQGCCWTEEVWTVPEARTMLGLSRTWGGGRMREFEFLRISWETETPVYYASPRGGTPLAFRRAEAAANHVSFLNAEHDYPQRISYRREGDTLVATISMLDGSRPQSWTYRRQP
jgi:hypothetical protein